MSNPRANSESAEDAHFRADKGGNCARGLRFNREWAHHFGAKTGRRTVEGTIAALARIVLSAVSTRAPPPAASPPTAMPTPKPQNFPLRWELPLGHNRPRRVVIELDDGVSAVEVFVPQLPLTRGGELVVSVSVSELGPEFAAEFDGEADTGRAPDAPEPSAD